VAELGPRRVRESARQPSSRRDSRSILAVTPSQTKMISGRTSVPSVSKRSNRGGGWGYSPMLSRRRSAASLQTKDVNDFLLAPVSPGAGAKADPGAAASLESSLVHCFAGHGRGLVTLFHLSRQAPRKGREAHGDQHLLSRAEVRPGKNPCVPPLRHPSEEDRPSTRLRGLKQKGRVLPSRVISSRA